MPTRLLADLLCACCATDKMHSIIISIYLPIMHLRVLLYSCPWWSEPPCRSSYLKKYHSRQRDKSIICYFCNETINNGITTTKIFCKSCRNTEFSEAAKVLNVTQSTLSQQVKQLETEIGTQLLLRSSHFCCSYRSR